MKLKQLLVEERAVSPVVGVALLIAITVILAAVIGGVVLGLGTGGVDTPQAQIGADLDPDDSNVTITHNGGEPLPADHIVVVIGDTEYEMDHDLTAGNSITQDDLDPDPDFDEDDEMTILWDDPDSDSTTVLERFSA